MQVTASSTHGLGNELSRTKFEKTYKKTSGNEANRGNKNPNENIHTESEGNYINRKIYTLLKRASFLRRC